MPFALGNTSRANLVGVHPKLVEVVMAAIVLTHQDFTVYEGLRTAERQKKLVAAGMSKTLNSKHIRQADGFGHAVDLVPWIDGQARWEWSGCYTIAVAMDLASTKLGVPLTWGGVWNKTMKEYGTQAPMSMEAAVAQYCREHPGPDFIDGPHYQLA